MVKALQRGGVDDKKIEQFKSGYFDRIEKLRDQMRQRVFRRENEINRASVGERLVEAKRLVLLGDPGATAGAQGGFILGGSIGAAQLAIRGGCAFS